MAGEPEFLIRSASIDDSSAIAAIYAPHVLTGVTSFELEAPAAEEIAVRIAKAHAQGFPYLVAVAQGIVTGYAYTSAFRARAAYNATVENSVYIQEDFQRRGIGRALLLELIRLSINDGKEQMIAVIADPAHHTASVELHSSVGFREVGIFAGVGEKFGKRLDVLMMQLALYAD